MPRAALNVWKREEGSLERKRMLLISVCGWFVVWLLWLFLTRSFHPTFLLAIVVTTSLVLAYAAAAYSNHLLLIPRFWMRGERWMYVLSLSMVMAILTALALAVIRISYAVTFGPDIDPLGLYKHYAIDFFGMVVHVAAAGLVVAATKTVALKRTEASNNGVRK